MANKNDRAKILKQIEQLEAEQREEQRRNPTPKNIVQLSQLIEMLQSDDWERSNYRTFFIKGILDAPAYEFDEDIGLSFRVFSGSVTQLHKHNTSGITIERIFDFKHREAEPTSLEITPDIISWQAPELIIKDGDRIIFNGYEGDDYSSDDHLDNLLKELLTPQIREAFDLSIDTSVLYVPVYKYLDDEIKNEDDLVQQWHTANELNRKGPYQIKRVRAVYSGTDTPGSDDIAFVGKLLAQATRSVYQTELFLTYGGNFVLLDDGDIHRAKSLDELPFKFGDNVIKFANASLTTLAEQHARRDELFQIGQIL